MPLALASYRIAMWFAMALFITLAPSSGAAAAGQGNKPPLKLVFPSKAGDVTFNHAAHLKREKGDCTRCHDKLWPQSAKVAVKSSDGCSTCHHAGGKSFEMKGNCTRCHAAKGATERRGG
jgi:c(7)-type cytochrome triheme protein